MISQVIQAERCGTAALRLKARSKLRLRGLAPRAFKSLFLCSLSLPYKLFPFFLRQRIGQQEGEKLRQRSMASATPNPLVLKLGVLHLLAIWAAGMRALRHREENTQHILSLALMI